MSKRTQRPVHIQRAFDSHNLQKRVIDVNDAVEACIVPAFEKLKEAAMQHEGDAHGNVAEELNTLWKTRLEPVLADLRTLEKPSEMHRLRYALIFKAGHIGDALDQGRIQDRYPALAKASQSDTVSQALTELVDAGSHAVKLLQNDEAIHRRAQTILYR